MVFNCCQSIGFGCSLRTRLQQKWFQLRDFAIAAGYEGLSSAIASLYYIQGGLSHLLLCLVIALLDNSAWADKTSGFAKVAEALYGFAGNGCKGIFHVLRSSVLWQFAAFFAQGYGYHIAMTHEVLYVHCHPFFCPSWCHSLRLFLQTTSLPRWVIQWVHVWITWITGSFLGRITQRGKGRRAWYLIPLPQGIRGAFRVFFSGKAPRVPCGSCGRRKVWGKLMTVLRSCMFVHASKEWRRCWRRSCWECFVQWRVRIYEMTNWDMLRHDFQLQACSSHFNLVQDWTHGTPKLKLARSISLPIRFQFPRFDFEVLHASLDMHRFSACGLQMTRGPFSTWDNVLVICWSVDSGPSWSFFSLWYCECILGNKQVS